MGTLDDIAQLRALTEQIYTDAGNDLNALTDAGRTIAQIRAELAAAQAALADVHTDGPEIIEVVDFTEVFQKNAGAAAIGTTTVGKVLPNQFIGKGVGKTILRMKPNTSTKAKYVPTTKGTTTNPFTLFRAGGGDDAHQVTGLELAHFTLQGTPQGHDFHSLMPAASNKPYLHDIDIVDTFGSGSVNPQETFGCGPWRNHHGRYVRINIIGGPNSASLWGGNFGEDYTLIDCQFLGSVHGIAATHYAEKGSRMLGCVMRGRHPSNYEQCVGPILEAGCDYSGQTDTGPTITINNNVGVSVPVYIVDPIRDVWPIRIGVLQKTATVNGIYNGAPQSQQVSDVTVIKDGYPVTKDTRFVRVGNVW